MDKMREIKFRAWNKVDNCWVSSQNEQSQTRLNYDSNHLVYWNNYELSQYTGSKDKNRKEAYHKDIFLINNHNKPYVIEWNFGGWGYYNENQIWIFLYRLRDKFEIIGNKFENPELIK
jgi:uncharacterized phage protein (TIGR01671 family)